MFGFFFFSQMFERREEQPEQNEAFWCQLGWVGAGGVDVCLAQHSPTCEAQTQDVAEAPRGKNKQVKTPAVFTAATSRADGRNPAGEYLKGF